MSGKTIRMIKIRERSQEDTEALRNLFFKERLKTFSWADLSEFSLSDFDAETKGEYILVASIDGMIAGFISVWIKDNFIHHLYVDGKFQNQGIGTQLLNAALAKIGSPISLKYEEKNTSAVRFYRQKGFIEKAKGVSKIGNYILFELVNRTNEK